jgi:hypothetical protein
VRYSGKAYDAASGNTLTAVNPSLRIGKNGSSRIRILVRD